jgi:hypothetical protein
MRSYTRSTKGSPPCEPGRLHRRIVRVAIAAAVVGAAIAGAGPAAAASAPTGGGLPDVDRRFEGVRVAPSAAQLSALRALGDVEVGWTELGTPHSLRARSGALTRPSKAAPDATARSFLRDNAELFRQQPGDIARLHLTLLDRDASGATFLRYRQMHGARQVHGSSMLIVLDGQRRVLFAGGTLAPSLGAAAPPGLTADQAVARTALNVSPRTLPPVRRQRTQPDASSTSFENTLALPGLRHAKPVKADLVTLPTATGGRTAWRVRAEVASNAEYETLVDAQTGDVLYRKNQWSSSEPHGLVHTGDDPEAGAQVANVLFSGIGGTWVAADTTSGNNTNAYQDLFDDETADAGDQPVNAEQHFDYTFSNTWGTTGVLPTTGADRDAVVTQLYYYTNWYHDYAYDLGFTETSRNFQVDNFGLGGTGGDAVQAEADDSYGDGTTELCTDSEGDPIVCRNNANFNAGGPDGSTPRMQMYVGEENLGGGLFRRTQRANNRDTVIHEYTHGISGRIISDGNLAGGVQSGALGEGWSDAFATSINNDPVYGEYNNGNYTTGIRGVAYDNSTRTYGDLCDIDADGCQVHADGTIWATALWEERAALVGKHGFAAAKSLHEDLLMLGLKATPDEPSFHDARTGYLLADALLDFFGHPDAGNQCLIWRVFADNELGVTAAPDDDDDTTPTISTDTPDECDPEAVIAPTPVTPEGTAVQLDGTGSIVGGDDGDTLTYAWDLDDDNAYDDSTSPTPSVTFGDNGMFTISLQVTNTAGYVDIVDAVVSVANVAPTVTIDAGQVTNVAEGESLPVLAHFTDPGWLDTYPSSSVDPGTTYLSDLAGTVAISDEGPPANVGTIQATLTYGDDGAFTVEVSLTDDDGAVGSDTFGVTVANVAPTATIDETGTTLVNGVPTVFADAGENVPLSARVQDPGSDDETTAWDWGDGGPVTPVINLINPPLDDPDPSPNVNARDFIASDSHAWSLACIYQVEFTVDDDDGGSASDNVVVLITGPPSLSRGAGYWQHQYKGNGKIDFSNAQLDCYLEIAAYLSNVFNEVRDASTRQKAHDDIFVAGLNGTISEQLDRQLLTAWINFANGGVEYTELLDTNGDGIADTAFADVMATAESVRLNPAATREQLVAQKDLLTAINGRDGL